MEERIIQPFKFAVMAANTPNINVHKRKNVEGNLDTPVKKKKQRKWTNEENLAILEYLSSTIRKGLIIEKPTAREYYKKLICEKGFQDCTPDIVRSKVKNFLANYRKALKWWDDTGQAIREKEGDKTFEDVMKIQFPYFEKYEEIWKDKANVHIPHVVLTEQTGENANITFNTDESHICKTEIISPIPQDEGSWGLEGHSDSIDDPLTTEAEELHALPRCIRGEDSPSLARMSLKVYEEISKLRTETIKAKLELQKEQIQLERNKLEISSQLDREKLEFDKLVRLKELDLRQLEIDSQIRLKEIEVEKLRLEVQLEQLRKH